MSGHLTGVQRATPWRVLLAERRGWLAVCLTCGWEHGPHRDRDVAAAYASLHRGHFRRWRWPVDP